MGFTLDQVVPWGRNLDEYRRMFELTEVDLQGRIAGVGDGPASFNAEVSALGGSVTSFDPLYAFSVAQIQQRIDETAQKIIQQVTENARDFNWSWYEAPTALLDSRLQTMRAFLADYAAGLAAGRYQNQALPEITLSDTAPRFDLVLCSHFLFLYEAHFAADFQARALENLLALGNEVRIYPLVQLDSTPSAQLPELMAMLAEKGIQTRFVEVKNAFQLNADFCLVLTRETTHEAL